LTEPASFQIMGRDENTFKMGANARFRFFCIRSEDLQRGGVKGQYVVLKATELKATGVKNVWCQELGQRRGDNLKEAAFTYMHRF